MNQKRLSVSTLATISLVMSLSAIAQGNAKTPNSGQHTSITIAQIDTRKITPDKKLQETISKPSSTSTGLRLAQVSQPTIASSRHATVQGRGDVEQIELSFLANVQNGTTSSQTFRIVTEVLGSSRQNRSRSITVGTGEMKSARIQFFTDFQQNSGSTMLPVTVILLDSTSLELGRVDRSVDIRSALTQLRGTLRSAGSTGDQPDLAVTNVSVRVRLPEPEGTGPVRAVRGIFIDTKGAETVATVTLRNAGRERWGYNSSVSVIYQSGTPGHLQPLAGTAGATKPMLGGLQSGESTSIDLQIPRALSPGFYYTATVTFQSREDGNASNNRREFTFFVENNGSVSPRR